MAQILPAKHLDIARAADALRQTRLKSPNDPIEQLFNTPVPKELWHYTSIAALEGILNSHRLWATEAHFTTDKSEFIHARDVALSCLQALEAPREDQKMAKELAIKVLEEEFESGALSSGEREVFVISFSSGENLKSQWSEYATQSRGVSIAFDLSEIRPPQELGVAVTLAPCIYEETQKKRLLMASVKNFMETAASVHRHTGDTEWVKSRVKESQMIDRIYGLQSNKEDFKLHIGQEFTRQLRPALALTTFDLLRLASHCKNDYFAEEKEWRLALPHTKGSSIANCEISYRGPNNDIPYIAHDLFSNERLPITRVMTGPLCESTNQVGELLAKYGYDIPVIKADSPIRRMDKT
jgi:hypothetical protein